MPDDRRTVGRKREGDLKLHVPVYPPAKAPHGVGGPAEDPPKLAVPTRHQPRGLIGPDRDPGRQAFGRQEAERWIAAAL